MTVFDAVRHQWTRRWRAATWGRTLVGRLLLLLGAAYFGLLLLGIGSLYPDVVAEIAPERDPLRLLNAHLLHGMVMLTAARFFLQRSAGSDVRPYRALPISEGHLTRLLQVTSALSLFNALPLVLLGALGASTVGPSVSAVEVAYWAIGVLVALILTQFVNSLLRVAWDRYTGFVIGAVVLLAVGVGLDALGLGGLRRVSAWCFGGLSAGRPGPLVALAIGTVAAGWRAHRALRARLCAAVEGTSPESGRAPHLSGLQRPWLRGQTASLVLLSIKLILRNKRPRQMLLLNVPILIGVVLFFGPQLAKDPFPEVCFGLLLSLAFASPYFQYGGFAWHGGHFDGLLTRVPSLRTLIGAQFALFAGLCLSSVLIVGPLVVWRAPGFLDALAALLLYNLGISGPGFLLLSTWNRTALVLEDGAFFNNQGSSGLQFLVFAVLMSPPLGLFFGAGIRPALWTLARVGMVGLCTAPLWIRGLGGLLRGQRHAMAAGFRDTE